MAKANDKQVGGEHYREEIQHWDFAYANDFDYFQGQITKYVTRWKKKNGMQDLQKALHFLQKYIELEGAKDQAHESTETGPLGYVDQDGPRVWITCESCGQKNAAWAKTCGRCDAPLQEVKV